MVEIHITDIIPLIGIPGPTHGRTAYNITCPCCDDSPGKKHLNINLVRMCSAVPGANSLVVYLIYTHTMPMWIALLCGKSC